MSRAASIRIISYVVIVAISAAAFLSAGIATWKKRNYWEKQIRQLHVDTVEFGLEYRASFRELNLTLLRYRLTRDPIEKAHFLNLARAMSQRFTELDSETFVPESKEILAQLSAEFGRYCLTAQALLGEPLSTAPRDLVPQIDAASGRILTLDQRLSVIERGVLSSFVTRVRGDMDRFWQVLYGGMALVLVSGTTLAWIAYRDLIAPLRRSVVQSRDLLERQEKLAALGLLTAGLAHEIRNPLNSMKARLFTQRRALRPQSSALEDNQFIEDEVDRLEGVVRNALQFARPDEPSFEPIRLQDALGSWCKLLGASLVPNQIQLRTEFRADAEVAADLNQLKQVILNLVKNAAESIGQKGAITIRSRPISRREGNQKRAAVAIEVEDTGPGIPPEVRERLFDPFFTTKENGSGLGLSIAARIAQAHGGTIEFESLPGSGAVFAIVLPVQPHSTRASL